MTTPDWPLAFTLCLILSVGWTAVLFAFCRLAERLLPAAEDRHILWWIGLVASTAPLAALAITGFAGLSLATPEAAPFFGSVLGSGISPANSGTAVGAAGGGGLHGMLGALRMAAPFAVAAYGIGLLWCGVSHLCSLKRLQRFLSGCRPLHDGRLQRAVTEWAARLGVRKVPPLLVTSEPSSPFAAQYGRRPILVMPEGLMSRCTSRQAALICAHELAHIARHDLVLMRAQSILRALFWFNPLAGAISARLDATREAACDDCVLNIGGSTRRDYAQAFLLALRHASGQPSGGIPFIHPCRKDHEMRLTNIMNRQPGRSRKAKLAVTGTVLAALAVPLSGGQAALAEALAGKAPEFSGAVVSETTARISSPFGPRKLKGKAVFHGGVDIAAPLGTPVLSPGKGRVLMVTAEKPAYGKLVEIDYGDDWRLRFAMLDSWTVAQGDGVAPGQQIGTVGQSGTNATGPHLHLEVWHKGKLIDPAAVMTLPVQNKDKAAAPQN